MLQGLLEPSFPLHNRIERGHHLLPFQASPPSDLYPDATGLAASHQSRALPPCSASCSRITPSPSTPPPSGRSRPPPGSSTWPRSPSPPRPAPPSSSCFRPPRPRCRRARPSPSTTRRPPTAPSRSSARSAPRAPPPPSSSRRPGTSRSPRPGPPSWASPWRTPPRCPRPPTSSARSASRSASGRTSSISCSPSAPPTAASWWCPRTFSTSGSASSRRGPRRIPPISKALTSETKALGYVAVALHAYVMARRISRSSYVCTQTSMA